MSLHYNRIKNHLTISVEILCLKEFVAFKGHILESSELSLNAVDIFLLFES